VSTTILAAAPAGSVSHRRAIALVCAASALFVLASSIVKAVAPEIPVFEIAWFRCVVSAVALLPVLMREGGMSALRTRHPWAHAGRTLAGLCGMVGMYEGYAALPLATATALSFAMPLCLTLLCIPMLGERVSRARLMAALGGFAGVLLMLRPWSLGEANEGGLPLVPVIVVLAGVVGWAFAMISIRRMGASGERNVAIVMYYSLGSAVVLSALSWPVWVTPGPWALAGLIAVGVLSAAAQMLMTAGYRASDGSLVAPFEYGAILYTTVIGAVIWGEIPDIWTLIGAAILVAAGIAIWRRA
jgi:drug/metabolite transporter (DMT)-like permease